MKMQMLLARQQRGRKAMPITPPCSPSSNRQARGQISGQGLSYQHLERACVFNLRLKHDRHERFPSCVRPWPIIVHDALAHSDSIYATCAWVGGT